MDVEKILRIKRTLEKDGVCNLKDCQMIIKYYDNYAVIEVVDKHTKNTHKQQFISSYKRVLDINNFTMNLTNYLKGKKNEQARKNSKRDIK